MQNDLISRSALERKLSDERAEWTPAASYHIGYCNGLVMAKSFVVKAPAVDAVEVVRCKDCARCDGFPEKEIEPNEIGICRINMMAVKPDAFCSYGERRADDGK